MGLKLVITGRGRDGISGLVQKEVEVEIIDGLLLVMKSEELIDLLTDEYEFIYKETPSFLK